MDAAHLSRLREEQDKAIVETNERITQWEEMKSNYVSLQDRLNTLSHQVSHDVMVPFGPYAFMPGKIIHTNEILVLLGDNWFVERSSKQAAEIAGRRIQSIEKSLHDLNEQKKLLEPRVDITSELQNLAQNKDGVKEIVEDYDSDEERKWREKHKRSVQAHRKKVCREREQDELKAKLKSELSTDELWSRLDELEAIENSRRELQRLKPEQPFVHTQPDFKTVFPHSTPSQTNSETVGHSILTQQDQNTKTSDVSHQPTCTSEKTQSSKRIQWTDTQSDGSTEDTDNSYDEDSSDDTCTSDQPSKTCRITFSHSSESIAKENTSSNTSEESNSTTTEHPPSITTPADIYKHYGRLIQPKSILKQQKQSVRKAREAEIEESRTKTTVKKMSDSAFSGTILEKSTSSVTQPLEPFPKPTAATGGSQRVMSKFRAARQKQAES